jgi:hypothetical protein
MQERSCKHSDSHSCNGEEEAKMREQKTIGIFLLLSALMLLTTCQLQLNSSSGNKLTLRIVIPGGAPGGGKSIGGGSRSLAGGASLTVTISQEGTAFSTQQTASLSGQTSVDFSFSLSSTGTYDVLAVMNDALGDILSQATTKFTVPAGNYPVVLTMYSSLLSNAVLTDSNFTTFMLVPPFSQTTFNYTGSTPPTYPGAISPFTLTLTTVDPKATITSVTVNSTVVVPPSAPGVYTGFTLNYSSNTIIIVVTAVDGSTTQTYTMTGLLGGG